MMMMTPPVMVGGFPPCLKSVEINVGVISTRDPFSAGGLLTFGLTLQILNRGLKTFGG